MPSLARSLFAFFLCVIIGLGVFSHFRGWVAGMADTISGRGTRYYEASVVAAEPPPVAPALPDISSLTVESITAKIPPFKKGVVALMPARDLPDLRAFTGPDGIIQRLRLAQREITPLVLVVREGSYDLPRLHAAAPDAFQKNGAAYTLRVPLLVARGATLNISGAELRLSQEQSVFIVAAGDLFVVKSAVAGWSEKKSGPAHFVSKKTFRPFINVGSSGHLHMAGSTVSALGYFKSRSYGLALSPGAAGVLIGNTFSGLYYGFYSRAADDVALVGNAYSGSVVYGIDTSARRQVIANNDVSGTQARHGIVLHGKAGDTDVFGNSVHDNAETGIVADGGEDVRIVNNKVFRNGGDGVAFFESARARLWGNKVNANGAAGIRMRNSRDMTLARDEVSGNGMTPVILYSTRLDGIDARPASAVVTHATIRADDRQAAFKIDNADSFTITSTTVLSGGPVIADNLFPDETKIVNNIGRASVVITREKSFLRGLKEALF